MFKDWFAMTAVPGSFATRLTRSVAHRMNTPLRRLGFQLQPIPDPWEISADMDEAFRAICSRMLRLGSFDVRLYTTYQAIRSIVTGGVPGDIVECGVYQGKQVIMMAHALQLLGVTDRTIFLYDTFAGMTKPTPEDFVGTPDNFERNLARWQASQQPDGTNAYKFASLESVQSNVWTTPYPRDKFAFVKGDVAQTVRAESHHRIALLRLDTDWYASTKHELEQLYDRVSIGGIVVIDDYGRWQGSRKATDEFWERIGPRAPMLTRTCTTERIAVKVQTS